MPGTDRKGMAGNYSENYKYKNVKKSGPYAQNKKIQEMIHKAEDVMANNQFKG